MFFQAETINVAVQFKKKKKTFFMWTILKVFVEYVHPFFKLNKFHFENLTVIISTISLWICAHVELYVSFSLF